MTSLTIDLQPETATALLPLPEAPDLCDCTGLCCQRSEPASPYQLGAEVAAAHREWRYLQFGGASQPSDEQAAEYAARYGDPTYTGIYPAEPVPASECPPLNCARIQPGDIDVLGESVRDGFDVAMQRIGADITAITAETHGALDREIEIANTRRPFNPGGTS